MGGRRKKEVANKQTAQKSQWHETLGVSPDASPKEIKKAYRKMAQQYHPDISKDPKAKEKMQEINEAFRRLNRKDSDHWEIIESAYQEAKRNFPRMDEGFWVSP